MYYYYNDRQIDHNILFLIQSLQVSLRVNRKHAIQTFNYLLVYSMYWLSFRLTQEPKHIQNVESRRGSHLGSINKLLDSNATLTLNPCSNLFTSAH